jgi:hypothetical protein
LAGIGSVNLTLESSAVKPLVNAPLRAPKIDASLHVVLRPPEFDSSTAKDANFESYAA